MSRKAKDRHFEHFRPHRVFKHLILRHYIEAWTRKLLLRPGAGDEVLLVDAFAGAGMDEQGQHGSPIILAAIARGVEAQLKKIAPSRDCRIRVVAIEKDAANHALLKENLALFGDRATAHRGTLADYLPELLSRSRGVPMMAFLDPCGVDGLDASLVRQILAVDRNEVLARFSDEGALRHFGAISAEQALGRIAPLQGALLLEEAGTPAISEAAQRSAERARAATQVTAARAREILDTALGGHDWQADIERFPLGARRRHRFVELYRELLADTGGRYTTVIPIWDADGQLDANLVHASRSPYGRSTMKAAVQTALRKSELPSKAKDLIRLDAGVNLEEVMRSAQQAFAGQTIRWAEDAPVSARRFVLQETDIFPHQLEDLQRRIRETGWMVPKHGREPLQISFPAQADSVSARGSG
jgi:three-Cys-motif partner protein